MQRRITSTYWSWLILLLLMVAISNCVQPRATPPDPTIVKPTANVAVASAKAPNKTAVKSGKPLPPQKLGVLVETPAGRPVLERAADYPFNPASTLKMATALYALRLFGPGFRFSTQALIDPSKAFRKNGKLHGDLYIVGRAPIFDDSDAAEIAKRLRAAGVRTVTGRIIVSSAFNFNEGGPADSGKRLRAVFRSCGIRVIGQTAVSAPPTNSKLIAKHQSQSLRSILKIMLCYSDNFIAHRLGELIGGHCQLRHFLLKNEGVSSTCRLESTSGLGINRLTARDMIKIVRALEDELKKGKLQLWHVLPLAGVDPGTLLRRYGSNPARGSVVAKTGTLHEDDGGVSALAGVMRTKRGGTLYFVIFNKGGNVRAFRARQDAIVAYLDRRFGGPSKIGYHK